MYDTNWEIYSKLQQQTYEPVRDPLWKHIYLTKGMIALVSSHEFQAMNGIKQLGPAYLVYPGAVHTRLSHSIGVYHAARKIILHFLQNFRENSVHGNRQNPFTYEGVKAFLAAALLHDIGHFPFTHSLKELPLKEHETLASDIILSSSELKTIIKEKIQADPQFTALIIDESQKTDNNEIAAYRNILSGALDPDKLDYLNRDAYFCGVPYGIQDIEYIISKMRWLPEDISPAIEISGSGAMENLLFSKYLMYKYVYWHRRVRSATAMVKKALFHALQSGTISAEDLYRIDDDAFFHLSQKKDHPFLDYIKQVKENRLFITSLEIPFNSNNNEHIKMQKLNYRSLKEKKLTEFLKKRDNTRVSEDERISAIIDIPEKITFEMNIPILGNRYSSDPPGIFPETRQNSGSFSEENSQITENSQQGNNKGQLQNHSTGLEIFSPAIVGAMEKSLRTIRIYIPSTCRLDREAAISVLNEENTKNFS